MENPQILENPKDIDDFQQSVVVTKSNKVDKNTTKKSHSQPLGIRTRPRPKAWPGCVVSFRQSAVRSPEDNSGMVGSSHSGSDFTLGNLRCLGAEEMC